METHKGRKKVQLSMRNNACGGGIEGVVMFGGALAFASLVAAFTLKKCNRKDSNKDMANLAAADFCREEEEDGAEGLRFILHESSSTLHQNSCCTNHGTSEIGITQDDTCELVSPQSLISLEEKMQSEREDSASVQREILIHDTEQESTAMTADVEEISPPVSEHEPMNVVENIESNESLGMETIEIEIEDEAVDADAEQPAEETSTLQSSLSSGLPKEEEKSSVSTGEEDEEEEEEEEEYSLMQSLFSTEEEDREEEEEYSLMQSLFSTEEEDREEEEYSHMQLLFSIEEEDREEEEEEEEEEYSPMRSSFSTEEEDEEEYSPVRPSFSTEEEEEEEENSPMESSFSTEEEEEEEDDDDDDDDDDENGEDVTEMEEDSGGTWSSSTESNTEAIWPAEMMVLSPESKEINISHGILSVKKFETDTTGKMENYWANAFGESSGNGKNKKETQELVVMNDQKEHSAKWQIWLWLGFVLVLLILLANCLFQPNTVFLLFFP